MTGGGKLALIKKAIFSAQFKGNKTNVYLLDGHNNSGFSGGPVIAFDYASRTNKAIGVISAYKAQNNKGSVKIGKYNFPFDYSENSGIIVCTPATEYVDIIKKIK